MMSRARGACEEGGKVGSADILAAYTEKKVKGYNYIYTTLGPILVRIETVQGIIYYGSQVRCWTVTNIPCPEVRAALCHGVETGE